jgi:hypothetical protein
MTTFTIETDNTITAFAALEDALNHGIGSTEGTFTSEKELAKLSAAWPIARFAEVWNGFAGVVPFGDLKAVKKFTDRKTATARIWKAIQIPMSAPKATKKDKAPKDAATQNGPRPPREFSKRAIVLDLLRRPDGATLAEIMAATDWQAPYADVRIMPTCVGSPVCGAGIAAMESA